MNRIEVSFKTDHYLCSGISDVGARQKNEDAFVLVDLHSINPAIPRNTICIGVFDGHGSDTLSQFCAKKIPIFLASLSVHNLISAPLSCVQLSLAFLYKKTTQLCVGASIQGTTACVGLVVDGVAYIANLGDSRCMMVDMITGEFEQVSTDHKPLDRKEKKRIHKHIDRGKREDKKWKKSERKNRTHNRVLSHLSIGGRPREYDEDEIISGTKTLSGTQDEHHIPSSHLTHLTPSRDRHGLSGSSSVSLPIPSISRGSYKGQFPLSAPMSSESGRVFLSDSGDRLGVVSGLGFSLSVSRGFGDVQFKPVYCSVPDLFVRKLNVLSTHSEPFPGRPHDHRNKIQEQPKEQHQQSHKSSKKSSKKSKKKESSGSKSHSKPSSNRLKNHPQCLIFAVDGLWDVLSCSDVARVIYRQLNSMQDKSFERSLRVSTSSSSLLSAGVSKELDSQGTHSSQPVHRSRETSEFDASKRSSLDGVSTDLLDGSDIEASRSIPLSHIRITKPPNSDIGHSSVDHHDYGLTGVSSGDSCVLESRHSTSSLDHIVRAPPSLVFPDDEEVDNQDDIMERDALMTIKTGPIFSIPAPTLQLHSLQHSPSLLTQSPRFLHPHHLTELDGKRSLADGDSSTTFYSQSSITSLSSSSLKSLSIFTASELSEERDEADSREMSSDRTHAKVNVNRLTSSFSHLTTELSHSSSSSFGEKDGHGRLHGSEPSSARRNPHGLPAQAAKVIVPSVFNSLSEMSSLSCVENLVRKAINELTTDNVTVVMLIPRVYHVSEAYFE
ncbi:Protein phosphatase 2C family like protein [Aduncisulcus paluster]|uniref:protein-serine/threonine phosphatase n=1 Tax=Aduncisulcus paluster TaxID=2918883 RepID=A0ABQ5JYQ0_9EUKA|nr:Protein phosphatase 2C family like protein [Aduncisulcus paluster]